MATYRQVHTRIWQDPDFEEYSPDEKLLFMWLITNSLTTESGIYPASFRRISNEIGIPQDRVEQIFRGGLKNISYDFENRCVFVHNFKRYNARGNPELVEKSIVKDCETIQTPLWHLFIEHYPRFAKIIKAKLKEINDAPIPPSISISRSRSIYTLDKYLPIFDEVSETLEENHKKVNEQIDEIGKELKTSKRFSRVFQFIGKMRKEKKHPGSILLALIRCEQHKPEEPWSYCKQIVNVESGNFYEADNQREATAMKEGFSEVFGNGQERRHLY